MRFSCLLRRAVNHPLRLLQSLQSGAGEELPIGRTSARNLAGAQKNPPDQGQIRGLAKRSAQAGTDEASSLTVSMAEA
jgi:hypothetical protein